MTGNPKACAAAIKTIEILARDKVVEHGRKMGEYALQRLQDLKRHAKNLKDVRGLGLLHLAAYPPGQSYGDGDSEDDQTPYQDCDHRTHDVVQSKRGDRDIPLSIDEDLYAERDEEQQRYSTTF